MPSSLLNQLRMMFRTTTTNREAALADNYTYVNEDKISRSLICPICLDPLMDPQTHLQCENSFCNRCIRKLKQCPCCRASIANSHELKMTSHVLRNILDELEVQCNVCKLILSRGNFASHIRNNCLKTPIITNEEETTVLNLSTNTTTSNSSTANKRTLDDQQIDKHLSNLYRRIHTLETELFELKKTIYVAIFFLSVMATLIFFGSIFYYIIISFLSMFFTQWIPSFVETIIRILFDFSPFMTLSRIIFIGTYFFLICYKRRPSDINLLTIIICLFIVLFNILVLALHVIFSYFHILMVFVLMISLAKYFNVPFPTNQEIIYFVNQFINQNQPRRHLS